MPSDKITRINYLTLLGVLLTCSLNAILCYLLLWNPYTLYFDRPEFSRTHFETREKYAAIATYLNLAILAGMTIVMIVKYGKSRRIFVLTPIFSILTLILVLRVQIFFPDAESEYTKDGYRYLEQSWYLRGRSSYKRFRSDKPFDFYKDHRTVVWRLDSSAKGE
jgi:hypothetical protein